MLWAACCVFFGFLRAGEFTLTAGQDFDPLSALTVQDMSVDQHANPSMVRLHQKQSKTDPFRHGVDVFLGRTNMVLCPVARARHHLGCLTGASFVCMHPDGGVPLALILGFEALKIF